MCTLVLDCEDDEDDVAAEGVFEDDELVEDDVDC